MPYFISAGDPNWDEYREIAADVLEPPISLFEYIKPWTANTAVLQFSDTPGPPPKAESAGEPSRQLSTEEMVDTFQKEQKATSEDALWQISNMTAKCRANGIKRVFGGYDGGDDESFTHFRRIEMSDGRVISGQSIDGTLAEDCEGLVANATAALMGRFGAGEFALYGAVVIDFDACTITDETDIDVVFKEEE
jgi:hypothetical protein